MKKPFSIDAVIENLALARGAGYQSVQPRALHLAVVLPARGGAE